MFGFLTRMENTLPVDRPATAPLFSIIFWWKQIKIYFNRRKLKRHYTLAIMLHFDFQRIDTADRLAVLCVQRCYSAYVGFNRWLFEFLVPFCCLQPVRSNLTSDTKSFFLVTTIPYWVRLCPCWKFAKTLRPAPKRMFATCKSHFGSLSSPFWCSLSKSSSARLPASVHWVSAMWLAFFVQEKL